MQIRVKCSSLSFTWCQKIFEPKRKEQKRSKATSTAELQLIEVYIQPPMQARLKQAEVYIQSHRQAKGLNE